MKLAPEIEREVLRIAHEVGLTAEEVMRDALAEYARRPSDCVECRIFCEQVRPAAGR